MTLTTKGTIMQMTLKEAVEAGYAELLVDGWHGIWIGNEFMSRHSPWQEDGGWDGWSYEDEKIILDGPDNWLYGEVWDEILTNAILENYTTGINYRLYQDDSLYMVRSDITICED